MELMLEELTKEFQGIKAVDHVTYTMHQGVYGLLGLNGTGKTTLMRMICTLLEPTSGRICLDEKDIFAMEGDYRKLLGYLPQEFGFYPDFSVQDYLLYIASIKGLSPVVAKKRVDQMLHEVGLSKEAKKKMKKLSGGMKRRAGIAQAMLNDPKILILDEPTVGLDPNERIRFRNLISELSEDRLVLLSTHIVSDIEYIANEILFMKAGRIEQSGTADDIMKSIPGKVWTLQVKKEEVNLYMERYQVSNMKVNQEGAKLRILSDEMPDPFAVKTEMTLEDAFLYYFGTKAGDYDAEI